MPNEGLALLITCVLAPGVGGEDSVPAGGSEEPTMRVDADAKVARIGFLSWDTEGGGRARRNLLRGGAGVGLRVRVGGKWLAGEAMPTAVRATGEGGTVYRITPAPDAVVVWSVSQQAGGLVMAVSGAGEAPSGIEAVEIVFPFDPRVTCTTALASVWDEAGRLQLPAAVVAPDFGAMLLTATPQSALKGRLEGRRNTRVDLIVELPPPKAGTPCTLTMAPLHLPPPKGLKDKALWRAARRGWLNAFQAKAKWGNYPPGLLGNNVVSDPASCSVPFYADMALFVPQVAPGVSIAEMVRRTVDFWLDKKTRPTGEVICYWNYGNFLEANSGPIIAAWVYVEAVGNTKWLARRIERLEFIAEFLAKRDVDNDGMIEATQSGNLNTLRQPKRSCAWFDAVNCGHKDGLTNAQIYRAFRCLAELEGRLGRKGKQARYAALADRLKAAYAKTLFNEKTGWLAWWRSADGELHDYACTVVNGLAVEYGLVDRARGKAILAKLRAKMTQAGFTRFDLGVPPVLVPIRRGDYLLDAIGCGKKADGSDTFGQYMNGGITAAQSAHFVLAHYVVGEDNHGDAILRAMLARQDKTGFQNGAVNAFPRGIDWTTWDGKPCGYEGYLADCYLFLLPVLLREPAFRRTYYRPLGHLPAPPPGPAPNAR